MALAATSNQSFCRLKKNQLTSLNIGHGAKPKLRLDVDVEAGRGTKDILNIIEKGQI